MKGSRWAAVILGSAAVLTFASPGGAASTCYSHEADEVADHGQVVNGNSVVLNPYQPGWIYGEAGRYGLLTVTSESGQIVFYEDPVANKAYVTLDQGPVLFWEVCKTDDEVVVDTTIPSDTTAAATTVPTSDTTTASTAPETTTPEGTTTVPASVPPSEAPTTTAAFVLDQDVTASTLPQTGVATNVALTLGMIFFVAGFGTLWWLKRHPRPKTA